MKGMFEEIGIPCIPSDWQLFIDSSSKSLEDFLLHIGNKFPSLPLVHYVILEENYNNLKMVLEALKYSEYDWFVMGDSKMVGFLMKLQGGYTKYPCHIC